MLLVRSVQSVREISSQRQEHSTGGVCAPQPLCHPLSSTTKMALASRQPSAATSTAPTPSRRRTAWRSSCVTPTSSATLSAGGCRRRNARRLAAQLPFGVNAHWFLLAARALQFPPEGWLRMNLNNGSITWLTIRPSGRVALRALGDAGFMPPDKLTRT